MDRRQEEGPLAELWESMNREPVERAVERFCAAHACSQNPLSADWKFFFPVPEGGRVLEVGSGFGDDVADLARRAAEVVCLVPSAINAQILDRHLSAAGVRKYTVEVNPDLTRLRLESGSVHAVAMEDAAAGGFGLSPRDFTAVTAEWKRVLVPGGTVFVGLTNRLARAAGRLVPVSSDGRAYRRESLNRVIKRAGRDGSRLPRLGRTIRIMQAHGFERPAIYAPLPDEHKTQLVIPVDDLQVVQYCLHHLVRRNSPVVRAAIGVASGLARLGWFRYCVPYHFLIFTLRA